MNRFTHDRHHPTRETSSCEARGHAAPSCRRWRTRLGERGSAALLLSLLVLGICGSGGCSVNPATGKRQFAMMSMSQEIALGAEAAPQFTEEFGGPVPDPELHRYISDIGRRMAAETEGEFPSVPWEFTLLNSPVINAFALPGGKVFITRGLAERLQNEAQLAGVIGHEIGHVTARHGNQRISQATGFQIGMVIVATVAGASAERSATAAAVQAAIPAVMIGGQLVLLKFGRDEELEADALGIRYMSRVGYNPLGQRQVMEIFAGLSSGAAREPEWLATHPFPENRVERITRMLAGEYAYTQNDPAFRLGESEYRRNVLDRLRALPPAPVPAALLPLSAPGSAEGTFAIGAVGSWCGCCAP